MSGISPWANNFFACSGVSIPMNTGVVPLLPSLQERVASIVTEQMDRFFDYMKVPSEERGFIQHLLSQPSDKSTLAVFADYLEEQRKKESELFRD